MRAIHRRVTGFCAVEGSDFAQKAGGARVFAILDQNGAGIAGFRDASANVKIWRKPYWTGISQAGYEAKGKPLERKAGRVYLNTFA
jgi:hypothetical protein